MVGVVVGVGNGVRTWWFLGVVGRVPHCVGVGVFLPVGIVRAVVRRIWRDILTCTAVMAWAGFMVWIMAWACRGAA